MSTLGLNTPEQQGQAGPSAPSSTFVPGQVPGVVTVTTGQMGPYLTISVQEYEALKKHQASTPAWIRWIGAQVVAHQGWAHMAASTWGAVFAAYCAVPEFRDFVWSLYTDAPSWLHRTLAGLVPVVLFYMKTRKPAQ